MIAGGYAVIFHGYGRTTGDLDLWVKPSTNNQKNILVAFKKMNFPTELLKYIEDIEDFSQPFAVKIGIAPLQVDVFNAITGVTYEDAEKNSISFNFSNSLVCNFIHLHDLITNKMLTGRAKDKADVEELHKINRQSKNKNILDTLKKLFGK